jgi:hypothetical protein
MKTTTLYTISNPSYDTRSRGNHYITRSFALSNCLKEAITGTKTEIETKKKELEILAESNFVYRGLILVPMPTNNKYINYDKK